MAGAEIDLCHFFSSTCWAGIPGDALGWTSERYSHGI